MIKKKIKIAFVLPSLGAGGAERIISFVAQNLNTEIFDPTLVVIGFKSQNDYNTGSISVVYLNKPRVLFSFFKLLSYFKNEKPNIAFSSIVHLNTLIAILSIGFPKIKFVAREASVLTELGKHEASSILKIQKLIITFLYKFLNVIVCQSIDMANDLIQNFNVSKDKIVLINNPITNFSEFKTKKKSDNEPIKFISVARLSKEKGIERIINILAQLKFPYNYTLIGDGNEKEYLFKLMKEKGVFKSVNYIPFTTKVDMYLAESDLFLQGSYVDGFPNAVLESCMVGTPVIAIQAPGGISEIIEDGINGFIVENIDEFILCLNKLNKDYMFKPDTVRSIVVDRFNKNKIILKYETLFLELMSSNEN